MYPAEQRSGAVLRCTVPKLYAETNTAIERLLFPAKPLRGSLKNTPICKYQYFGFASFRSITGKHLL